MLRRVALGAESMLRTSGAPVPAGVVAGVLAGNDGA